ncbi:MAG: sulfate adenylyltransferase, partial [Fibrobacter sp.]|nr:sulfate adenylyltransferase [Fibrobacter sp.]
ILYTNRNVEEAHAGEPVTITLDREVDVSRGCVLARDASIGSYKKIKASLLWMDDEPLSLGKDYLVKIGTKIIPGTLTKIDYAIDVNTGAHLETESLSKNGIAVAEIVFAEAIVADRFANHKTLGELILIDRVTHATSACGVVEELFEKQIAAGDKAAFVQGERHGRGEIFEEFFYDTATLSVVKQQPIRLHYTVGDEIPTVGETYHYPDDFDIIILRDSISVKVRGKRITAVSPVAEYSYGNVPVINGRGFELAVHSDEEVHQLLSEYEDAKDSAREAFFKKWSRFDTYRKVVIH